MQTLLLIDGNPLMWRAAYAHGEHYVAHGIARYFFEVVEKFDCPNALVLWDAGKSRWRSEYFPDYKENRADRKQEFDLQEMSEQKKAAQRYLSSLGVRNITVYGVEADDLISWFSKYFYRHWNFDRIVIASRDRDLWQLINEKVVIYDFLSDMVVDAEVCKEKFGVYPADIVPYKAMVGDVSDNLPGVKGVGEKTAQKLLAKYGGLGGLFDSANKKEISKSKIANRVLTNSEDLETTYQLVKLPDLEESWAYLSEKEYSEFSREVLKDVARDPMTAQIEAEVMGFTRGTQRVISSLSEEVKGIMGYVAPRELCETSSLTALDEIIKRCSSCGLRSACGDYGPTLAEGRLGAQIMLVGRNPGKDELTLGRLFVGKSGELVDEFLEKCGITREQCWITNACKCFSPNNRPPTYGEISACSSYLRNEINLLRPKFIIAFGNEAMSCVTPYRSGVTKHVGDILERPMGSIGQVDSWVGIMVHPSSALRSSKGMANFEYGVDKIKEFLDERRS